MTWTQETYETRVKRSLLIILGGLLLIGIIYLIQSLATFLGWVGFVALIAVVIVILALVYRRYGKIVPWKTIREAEQERQGK